MKTIIYPTELARLIERAERLYTLPQVAVRILQLTAVPQPDLRAIKDCLECDPALTVKLLRTVNSSLFGLSRAVTNLNQALNVLGMNPLKMLVLGFCLPEKLFLGINAVVLQRYWRRTLIHATAARELCRQRLSSTADDAFVAGLLGNVGQLALIQEFGEVAARLPDVALAEGEDLTRLEIETLGVDHVTLGTALLEKWNLPGVLVRVVATGLAEPKIAQLPKTEQPLADILRVADRLADCLAENRQELWPDVFEVLTGRLGMNISQVQQLVAVMQEQVAQLTEVLLLELPDGQDYQAILQAALERLGGMAAEQVAQQLRGRQLRQLEHERPCGGMLNASPPGLRSTSGGPVPPAQRLAVAALMPAIPKKDEITVVLPAYTAWDCHPGVALAERVRTLRSMPRVFQEVDQAFVQQATVMAEQCRAAHAPLSLVLLAVDKAADLILLRGLPAVEGLLNTMAAAVRAAEHPGVLVWQISEIQFALALPDCERKRAIDIANDLQTRAEAFSTYGTKNQGQPSMTLSIGIATVSQVPKNFLAATLITAAQRCLGSAQLSGGKAIKSIEVA